MSLVPYLSEDYPVIGLINLDLNNRDLATSQDVSFSGLRTNYCVSYVDLVNSTKIASQLSEQEVSTYYGIFLNSVARIAKNFGARIIKNAGDCLIYYFPKTSVLTNTRAFKQVIECAVTMFDARQIINIELYSKNLPAINYRISADYGRLEMVKTTNSRAKDFFGSTMNLCAKINAKAKPNSMVIGDNLYKVVKSLKGYRFKNAGSYSLDSDTNYVIYSVVTTRQFTNRFSEILQAKRALKEIGK
jgi:class 3 adenylate cyclase